MKSSASDTAIKFHIQKKSPKKGGTYNRGGKKNISFKKRGAREYVFENIGVRDVSDTKQAKDSKNL